MRHNGFLRFRALLSLMSLGFGGWKLFGFLVTGALASFSGDKLFLPFESVFYTVFLLAMWYFASAFRDGWASGDTLSLLTLWPIDKKIKHLLVQLRGTWLPALLMLLGGKLGVSFFKTHEGLGFIFYGLSAAYLIGALSWKGDFTVVDGGSFVGKVSVRQKNGLDAFTLLLSLSPILMAYLPTFLVLFFSVLCFGLGTWYGFSDRNPLQVSGVLNVKEKMPDSQKGLGFLSKVKNPALRYFCFLEFEFLKRPVLTWFISLVSSGFVALTYYLVSGFFSAQSSISSLQRGQFLGLVIAYGVFYLQETIVLESGNEALEIMLPFSKTKQFGIRLASRLLRPLLFVVLNAVLLVPVFFGGHRLLELFLPQPEVLYGEMAMVTFGASLMFVPFVLATLSALRFVSRGVAVFFQQMALFGAATFSSKGHFVLTLLPLFFLVLGSGHRFWVIENLLSFKWVALCMIVFMACEFGFYWTCRRHQVIK